VTGAPMRALKIISIPLVRVADIPSQLTTNLRLTENFCPYYRQIEADLSYRL
jgi:hypothetical protein